MKLPSIQILRAFAAIFVVIFHAQGLTIKYSSVPSFSGSIMGTLGAHGVDLFTFENSSLL